MGVAVHMLHSGWSPIHCIVVLFAFLKLNHSIAVLFAKAHCHALVVLIP
jgi:hypothetical protein